MVCDTPKKTKFSKRLYKYSNPQQAQKMAYRYLGKTAKLYPSKNPHKKYRICDKNNNNWVNFGQLGYEDYTKHHDENRLTKFKNRNWKWQFASRYSPAFLSWYLLWT
jgi:hypothetical protein